VIGETLWAAARMIARLRRASSQYQACEGVCEFHLPLLAYRQTNGLLNNYFESECSGCDSSPQPRYVCQESRHVRHAMCDTLNLLD
jgi:hypothetical protein